MRSIYSGLYHNKGCKQLVTAVVTDTASSKLTVGTSDLSDWVRENCHLEDGNLRTMFDGAIDLFERLSGFQIKEKTVIGTLDGVPKGALEIAEWPLKSVDQISYFDRNGEECIFDASRYNVDLKNGLIQLNNGEYWECYVRPFSSYCIKYSVGTDKLEGRPRQAVLMLLGHFYENREASISGTIIGDVPLGVETIMRSMKRFRL